MSVAERIRESDSPAARETPTARAAPDTTSSSGDRGSQTDEHAAMRQAVAREYADALGRRYEPPSEEPGSTEKPKLEDVEIDKRKISEYATQHDRMINSATGLTAKDADRIEAQIRDGVKDGTPVAGKTDQHGRRFSVDVPLTGPAGTMTVRTAWIVEPGGDKPRLATISFPPNGK